MKKNIDLNKVSNFKNTEMSYHKHSTFCMKTKPNSLYFNREVKRLTQQMRVELCTEELKQKNPALYFSILGKKMPKKYLKLYEAKAEIKEDKVSVTDNKKDIVEETSKDNELLEYQKRRDLERAKQIEEDRKKENKIVFKTVEPIRKDPLRGMRFVKCNNDPINKGRLGHSKAFLKETIKEKIYYG